MPRPNDFGGGAEYGKEESWSYMRDTVFDGTGIDISGDSRLVELFDRLLPDYRGDYPEGSRDAVELYVDSAFEALQDHLAEEYGTEYDLAEFFEWGDWRENYDDVA